MRRNDPFMEIIEAEKFEKKLAALSRFNAEERKRYRARIDARESDFEERHSLRSADILEERMFNEEAAGDENWNYDQPL